MNNLTSENLIAIQRIASASLNHGIGMAREAKLDPNPGFDLLCYALVSVCVEALIDTGRRGEEIKQVVSLAVDRSIDFAERRIENEPSV